MISRAFRASRGLSIVGLALAAASFVVACNAVPRRPGSSVETLAPSRLDAQSPIDVVVAPIANASGSAAVPAELLREAFQRGLVKRRYSPLALEFVDRTVVDASYTPGALQEEAVLQITVDRWDASLWESHRALTLKVHARMIDATNPTGGDLWAGRVERRFDIGNSGESAVGSRALLMRACDQIASEVLAALPARNPAPGMASGTR